MNYSLGFLLCTLTQAAWIVGAGFWFWRRRDELPLVVSGFSFYVFSFRFWAILNGLTIPVDISPFGFAPISADQASEAQIIAALGETVLLGVYMMTQKNVLGTRRLVIPPPLLKWLQGYTFTFTAVAVPATLLARYLTQSQVESGKVMAFEMSAYLYELPLVLISVAILLVLLWKCGGLVNTFQHFLVFALIGLVAMLTFGATARFQFLGWLLAVTIIMSTGGALSVQVTKMLAGLTLAIVFFGIGGAMRNKSDDASLGKDTWDRLFMAEDANMLDGLVLLRQVYPRMLPYEYGAGHLEILERPIPRAFWPGKPVGGYMNKLGLTTMETGFTLGISPGLVGSFYEEGGLPAVVLLSALYGYGLGRLVRFSSTIAPFAGALIRAICCASLVPLLRGGDLPGIYAWIFMAFWPCFVVLWRWRRVLFARQTPQGVRRPQRLSSLASRRVAASRRLRPT